MSGKEMVKKYLLLGLKKKAANVTSTYRPETFAFSISSVQGHFKCKRFDCCDDCDGHLLKIVFIKKRETKKKSELSSPWHFGNQHTAPMTGRFVQADDMTC